MGNSPAVGGGLFWFFISQQNKHKQNTSFALAQWLTPQTTKSGGLL